MNARPSLRRLIKSHFSIGLLLVCGLIFSACEVVPAPSQTQAPTPSMHLRMGVTGVASLAPTSAPAATAVSPFPNTSQYAWTPFASGLDQPVDIQNAGDGSGRLFAVERPGRIMVIKNDRVLPTPFLDIHAKVESGYIEQGLLGLAFHPNYPQNGFFYINYIDLNGNTVIARFHVSAGNADQADPASETDLLHVQQPYKNHNGGSMVFGPDGYLYTGLGDGGSEGDPLRTSQNLQTWLGKILRIDVDHGTPYSIPADNPFAKGGGLAEIWEFGLRNPWRFSFDTLTKDLYIGDVGQDSWEEIDFVPAGTPGGLNFGWSFFEGMHPFQDQPPTQAHFVQPVAEYPHSQGCSITGGYVYHGQSIPAWQGVYLYGDYCSGNIWGLLRGNGNAWQSQLLFSTSAKISTFGMDEAGELYLADMGTGAILRLARQP